MHVTRKIMKVFMGPVLEEGRLKSIKTIYHLIRLVMVSSKIFVLFLWPKCLSVNTVSWAQYRDITFLIVFAVISNIMDYSNLFQCFFSIYAMAPTLVKNSNLSIYLETCVNYMRKMSSHRDTHHTCNTCYWVLSSTPPCRLSWVHLPPKKQNSISSTTKSYVCTCANILELSRWTSTTTQ